MHVTFCARSDDDGPYCSITDISSQNDAYMVGEDRVGSTELEDTFSDTTEACLEQNYSLS